MATVQPLGDRVLVRVIGRERVTTGGIVLPDNVREESDRGLVVAVGPGAPQEDGSERPVAVNERDVILFSPFAGTRVAVGPDNFLLLREHDILGVLVGVEVEEKDGKWRILHDTYASVS